MMLLEIIHALETAVQNKLRADDYDSFESFEQFEKLEKPEKFDAIERNKVAKEM